MSAAATLNLPLPAAFLNRRIFAGPGPGAPSAYRLNSRIGEVAYDPQKIIALPRGIFGFAGIRKSILLQLDPAHFGPLNLLQIVDEPRLAFLFYPDTPECSFYRREHLLDAYRALGCDPETAAALVLATVRAPPQGITLNLRAPILVNTSARTAIQHILSDGDYPVRFKP